MKSKHLYKIHTHSNSMWAVYVRGEGCKNEWDWLCEFILQEESIFIFLLKNKQQYALKKEEKKSYKNSKCDSKLNFKQNVRYHDFCVADKTTILSFKIKTLIIAE